MSCGRLESAAVTAGGWKDVTRSTNCVQFVCRAQLLPATFRLLSINCSCAAYLLSGLMPTWEVMHSQWCRCRLKVPMKTVFQPLGNILVFVLFCFLAENRSTYMPHFHYIDQRMCTLFIFTEYHRLHPYMYDETWYHYRIRL